MLAEYRVHYNTARPHQGIAQRVPDGERDDGHLTVTGLDRERIHRKPVLGMDGLLAVVADVRRLREARAGSDIGGERCLEMLPCPLEPAGGGNRAGVGGVPGGQPGGREPSAGLAGRADSPCDGRRERG